ncbi:MAG: hypothetical protein ACPGJS_22850 [Flammeovirgaceae bacterium]
MPYISENLVSQPFNNQNLILEKGLHLHFILPKFLRTTLPLPDASGQLKDEFPPVPNRWMVVKNGKHAQLIESDFLHAEQSQHKQGVSVPIPWNVIKDKNSNYSVPFRYMGRQGRTNSGRLPNHTGNYWPELTGEPLTALGYGELAFSSFLPNCKGVFSFLDQKQVKVGDEYEVWGWYDFGENTQTQIDRLYAFLNQADTTDKKIALLLEEWELSPINAIELTDSNDLLLYGKFRVDQLGEETAQTTSTDYKIAVGNTGTEAVNAFLADALEEPTLEHLLEAIQFDSLHQLKNDIGAKFSAARHRKSFEAEDSGIMYRLDVEITPHHQEASHAQKAFKRLMEEEVLQSLLQQVEGHLYELNQLQKRYDKNKHLIAAKRHQLFADWYKYMVAAHPPYQHDDQYPRADRILQFMFNGSGRAIQDLEQQTGVLDFPAGSSRPVNPHSSAPIGLAKRILEAVEVVFTKIAGLNQQIKARLDEYLEKIDTLTAEIDHLKQQVAAIPTETTDVALQQQRAALARQLSDLERRYDAVALYQHLKNKQIHYRTAIQAGQRFYEPQEPVLLIANQGNTEQRLVDVAQKVISFQPSAGELPQWAKQIRSFPVELMKQFAAQIVSKSFAQHQWLFLEWDVQYHPFNDPVVNQHAYDEKFIFEHYDIRPDSPNFSPIGGKKLAISSETRRYTGATLLSFGAQQTMRKKIKDYLAHHKDVGGNLQKALDYLDEHQLLTQSLGGFNQALLMRKQTMQLEVADPIAFEDYLDLIQQLKQWIGDTRISAPEPRHYFNPIRAGGFVIHRLRLIDSFGFYQDIYQREEHDQLIKAQTLAMPSNVTLPKHFEHLKAQMAYLPPRFTQSARINLNWLPSKTDEEDFSANPIAGWAMPNFLDKSVAIFDRAGELLGNIGLKKVKTTEANRSLEVALLPKAGEQYFYLSSVEDEHLRNFINYFIDDSKFVEIKRKNPKAREPKAALVRMYRRFMDKMQSSLDYIEPEGNSLHNELVWLTGRPLAIVRFSVNLELMGDYAINQDWDFFKKDLYRNNPHDKRETYGFEQVKIPLRIGDYDQMNDGVIGFWYRSIDKTSQKLAYQFPPDLKPDTINLTDTFYMPLEGKPKPSVFERQAVVGKTELKEQNLFKGRDGFIIEQSLADEAQTIVLLFDPRAQLNVSAGVLPVKSITIPAMYYKEVMNRLSQEFLVAPMITPFNQLQIPLPKATSDHTWSWLELNKDEDRLIQIPARPNISREKLEQVYWELERVSQEKLWNVLIEANWLTPIDDKQLSAKLTEIEHQKPLPISYVQEQSAIESILSDFDKTAVIEQIHFDLKYTNYVKDKTNRLWKYLIDCHWLVRSSESHAYDNRAYINFDVNSRKPLVEFDKEKIDNILNTYFDGIVTPSVEPTFEQLAIREGWIVLQNES